MAKTRGQDNLLLKRLGKLRIASALHTCKNRARENAAFPLIIRLLSDPGWQLEAYPLYTLGEIACLPANARTSGHNCSSHFVGGTRMWGGPKLAGVGHGY
jgi:hypothetical protein